MLDTIQLNSKNDLVKVAKYLMGYSKKNEATDVFDKAFQQFVIKQQTKNKIEANGIIDNINWGKIASCAPTCSTKQNKDSAYVCALQILLGGLEVDGNFGQKTKKAVAAFQSARGLNADGICGPMTWKTLIAGEISSSSSDKIINDCVKYLQWDSRWKKVKYSTHTSKQTIGNSGCGTTSMAMILATWYDKKITPVETSKLAVDNGYRTYDSGTDWDFYKFCYNKYDCFSKFISTSSVTTLMVALREGALAVCSMNGNDSHFWTKQGCESGPFQVNLYIQGVA